MNFKFCKDFKVELLYATIVSIPAILRNLEYLPEMPAAIYYSCFLIAAIAALTIGKRFRINVSTLTIIVIATLSIAVNEIPPQFEPAKRLISFALLIIAAGPLITRTWLTKARLQAMEIIGWSLTVVTVISFIMYYATPNFIVVSSHNTNIFIGLFKGAVPSSCVAALATLFLMHKTFSKKQNISILIIGIILILICFFTCILAGSRIALTGLGIAMIFWIWQRVKNIKKFLLGLTIAVAAIAITYPLWRQYTDVINYKLKYAKIENSFFASREDRWKNRLMEISEKPLIGVGFGYTKYNETRFSIRDHSVENLAKGIIEPGSSWLFIPSSIGLFALAIFSFLYAVIFIQLLKIPGETSIYLNTILIYLGIVMTVEGFALSSGSLFCLILWLTLGSSLGYIYQSTPSKPLSILSKPIFCINIAGKKSKTTDIC